MDTMLAQQGIDDWVEIIIVALIFGASAIGAVSKKLIEVFSPKDQQDKPTSRPRQQGGKPAPPPTRPRPSPSTISTRMQPVPPPHGGPQRRQPPARPARTPLPPPVVARPTTPPPPRPAPTAKPAEPRRAVPPGVVPAEPRRKPASPARRRTAQPDEPVPVEFLVSTLDHEDEVVEAAVVEHLGVLESKLTLSEEEFARAVEARMGRMDADLTTPADASDAKPAATGISTPTRSALRHAVVMNEILGLPVALRPPDSAGTTARF
ncbi:MAG: hypothetical protein PVI86_13515 [Phycisphaerae bacterium]